MQQPHDLDRHRPLLGLLFLGANVGGVLAAFIVAAVLTGGGLISGDAVVIDITRGLATFVSGLLLILGLPGAIVGIGLLRGRPWADTAAPVIGALSLLALPFGTALGAYTLWVYFHTPAAHPNELHRSDR